MKITLSLIKADVGGLVGHGRVHPKLIEKAKEVLEREKDDGLLIDYHVTACGDDLQLIFTHHKGEDSKDIHGMAWRTFEEATKVAKSMKLYGAGQDLLKDSFSGNLKGMGPGIAEMGFEERPSEPVICLMADKTDPGAWNLPMFRIFADPMSTPGLVIDKTMHKGFEFEVHDLKKKKKISLSCPVHIYDLLAFIGTTGRYCIKRVFRSDREIAAVTTTEKLSLIAGKYVGKDDPAAIVRAQAGMPSVGEILEPFAFPHLVSGFMRGSHRGPLMPVSLNQAHPTRLDGPPRVVALGFQLNEGNLIGPVDLFDDPSFDHARQTANIITDYIRRHGIFEPHRLGEEEMEYTTMSEIIEKLDKKFEALE